MVQQDYDDLVARARIASDIEARTRLWLRVRFKQQTQWVTMNHSIAIMVLRDRVKEFRIHSFGGVYFYGVDVTE